MPLAVGIVAALSGLPGAARAQDAVFQDFFFNVCTGAPTGALFTRCASTPGAGGNISGDSENSLNPGQALTANAEALSRAKALADVAERRLRAVREEDKGGSAPPDAPTAIAFERWGLWLNGSLETFDRERDTKSQERGAEGDAWKLQLGVDYRVTDRAVVGVMAGFETLDSDFDADQPGVAFSPPETQGGKESETVSINLYGSYGITDRLTVDALAGVGFTKFDFQRNAVFQESTRATPTTLGLLKGESDGMEIQASVGIDLDLSAGALAFGPYARARFTKSKIDAYTETDTTGSGLAMNVDVGEATSYVATLGARASYAFSFSWGVVIPQARLEYEHEFDDGRISATTSYVLDSGGNQLTREGGKRDQNFFNAGGGAQLLLPGGWSSFVDVESVLGLDNFSRHRFTVGVRKEL